MQGREVPSTANIDFMFVTLDVSRLSGWLNADASYRVERGHMERVRNVDQRLKGVGR